LGLVLDREPELERGWRMLQHLYGISLAQDDQEANQALGACMNKLGVLKRMAYGFTNLDNFRARAILISPGLPSLPHRVRAGPSHGIARNQQVP
jgi:hypothetical protein